MVNILAHRGMWTIKAEQNTIISLLLAIRRGFGIETDIRDNNSKIVISHDLPKGNESTLEEFLDKIQKKTIHCNQKIALNIKADGLETELIKLLSEYNVFDKCFVFDMSFPTMLSFSKHSELKIATRISEFESLPVLLERSEYIWVDSFEGDFSDFKKLFEISVDRNIVFVSPELHKRDYNNFWQTLKNNNKQLYLCTDFPQVAQNYFRR